MDKFRKILFIVECSVEFMTAMESLIKNGILEIPPNAIKYIRKIYNLDKPERLEEAINILQEWLKKQDHLLKKDFDRGYLERSIILSKGSVEKAKKQIDRLCTLKTLLPNYFEKTNAKLEFPIFQDGAWLFPIPKLTEDYYRIVCFKTNAKAFTAQTFLDYYYYSVIACEYLRAHEYANGFILILDYLDANFFDLITKIDSVDVQRIITIIIEGYGARLKGLYLLTQSKAVDIFVNLLKQFLSKKIASRLHVHKTIEELYEIVPRHILPKEYGGEEKSFDELQELWMNEISSEEHVKYMKMMNKACTDEKLRRPDKFNEEYMGTPGAFRNLSVD